MSIYSDSSSRTDVSVIVATCNRASDIAGALQSLFAQETASNSSFTYDVVVVDDGSTDDTPSQLGQCLQAAPPHLRVSSLRTSGVGVAAARNVGARAARGDWIAFFDDDQAADEKWLAEMHRIALDSGAGLIGGAVRLSLPPGTLTPGPRVRRLLGEHALSLDAGCYRGGRLPGTGNSMVRRDVFESLGGFDQSFQGGSDTDFFSRVYLEGHIVRFAPKAVVWHLIPPLRLTRRYQRWLCHKIGAGSARIELRCKGTMRVVVSAFIRLIVAVARDVPMLAVAVASRSHTLSREAACSLWYTEGFIRGAIAIRRPFGWTQARFSASLNFRDHGGERAS